MPTPTLSLRAGFPTPFGHLPFHRPCPAIRGRVQRAGSRLAAAARWVAGVERSEPPAETSHAGGSLRSTPATRTDGESPESRVTPSRRTPRRIGDDFACGSATVGRCWPAAGMERRGNLIPRPGPAADDWRRAERGRIRCSRSRWSFRPAWPSGRSPTPKGDRRSSGGSRRSSSASGAWRSRSRSFGSSWRPWWRSSS